MAPYHEESTLRLRSKIRINKRTYAKGAEVPWYVIYPFFLVHMLMFGVSGFVMAYASKHPPMVFLYLHGGIAIVVYLAFYLSIFGRDEVKWMFINAALGFLGIYSQLGWLLSLFGRNIDDYPVSAHVIPFLYFVLYTFLIRQAVLDITHAREDNTRKKHAEYGYIVLSVAIYAILYGLEKL